MAKPAEKDFERAAEMLRSNDLDYRDAVVCICIMKAFMRDEDIPHYKLSRFRHMRNCFVMKRKVLTY